MRRSAQGLGLLLLAALPGAASSEGGGRADASSARQLRFMRDLRVRELPAGGTQPATACALLDGSVYAHASSGELDDLRLYAGVGGRWDAVPLVLRKSGTERVDDDPAAVRNLMQRGGAIDFDLQMPARPYTAVVLDLAARDFIGTAEVWGLGPSAPRKLLASFTVFDLSGAKLSRSTVLPLQEAAYPELHVALRLRAAPGTPPQAFPVSVVRGASVPPSREAQTLYAPVAETRQFVQRHDDTVATLHVEAHTPVERVAFAVNPGFRQNFLRRVTIKATPDGARDGSAVESLDGEISQVHSPAAGAQGERQTNGPGEPPTGDGSEAINDRELQFSAVLGANLREGATVEIDVANGNAPPLPLQSVRLMTRQLQVCFPLVAGATGYRLFYGGEASSPPEVPVATLTAQGAPPAVAVLGPEQSNPDYMPVATPRVRQRSRAELLWGMVALGLAAMAAVAVYGARHSGGGSR